MRIHPAIFMGVGFLVSVFSQVVMNATGSQKLVLFFYGGILLFILGLVKLLRKPTPREGHSAVPQRIMTCPYCGVRNWASASYCHRCRSPLR